MNKECLSHYWVKRGFGIDVYSKVCFKCGRSEYCGAAEYFKLPRRSELETAVDVTLGKGAYMTHEQIIRLSYDNKFPWLRNRVILYCHARIGNDFCFRIAGHTGRHNNVDFNGHVTRSWR